MGTILVVDDDTPILTVISDALDSEHEVHTAESVFQAEDIVKQNKIDLIIADLVMPEKNGIDMIMQFKKTHPEMKILAISGGGGITGRFDYLPIAKLVGAQDTLKKPFAINELRKKVQEILGS